MQIDEFKAALAERDGAILNRLEKFGGDIGDKIEELRDRVEEIESKGSQPGPSGGGETRESRE